MRAVHAAAIAKASGAAEVGPLQTRVAVIEGRAAATLAERARHQQQVTETLLADGQGPAAAVGRAG